jgi:putative flippase GtrA
MTTTGGLGVPSLTSPPLVSHGAGKSREARGAARILTAATSYDGAMPSEPLDPSTVPAAPAPRTSGQAVRFLVVGLLSYVVDVATLWTTVSLLGWPLLVGTTAAFAVAFVVNFGLGRSWVFRATAHRSGPQVVRYAILVAVNYLLTLVLVSLLTGLGLGLILAKTLTVAVNAVLNFFVGRHWVYR